MPQPGFGAHFPITCGTPVASSACASSAASHGPVHGRGGAPGQGHEVGIWPSCPLGGYDPNTGTAKLRQLLELPKLCSTGVGVPVTHPRPEQPVTSV